MEVRNLRLCDLDFDRKQLKVVQGKGKKRPLFATFGAFDSGIKKYIKRKNQKLSLWDATRRKELAEFDFAQHRLRFRYSQQGVQWAVKQASKRQNIERSECSYASAQFCDASSGRWDGYFKHQNLLGHENY